MNRDLLAFAQIEEDVLASRLQAVRAALEHAGEKGRSLEGYLIDVLNPLLPDNIGLTTGFIAFIDDDGQPTLTKQLDVIIYDKNISGPIIRLPSCCVIPLESSIGYMEVKSTICNSSSQDPPHNSIQTLVAENRTLRSFRFRELMSPSKDSPTKVHRKRAEWLSLRSFAVAFEPGCSNSRDPNLFAQAIADELARQGDPAHFHGILVIGSAYYATVACSDRDDQCDKFNVRMVTDHPLAAFKWGVLEAIYRWPKWSQHYTAALDLYLKGAYDAKKIAPQQGDRPGAPGP